MLLLIGMYLGLVVMLPLGLSAAVNYRTLTRGRECPLCRDGTYWEDSRILRLLKRIKSGDILQRRFCVRCGWEGLVRMPDDLQSQAAQTPSYVPDDYD